MPYVDVARLRAELAPVDGTPDGTAATLTDAKLTDCAEGASAEVDAALATAGYRITGAPPKLVVEVTAALAAYDADHTYREGAPQEDTDPVYRRWRWAQDMLALWAKGERLPLELTPPTSGGSSDLIVGTGVRALPEVVGDELLGCPDPLFPPDNWYDPDYYRHWSS